MQRKPQPKWSVLVVDDEPLSRTGLTRLLEGHPQLTVCGELDSVPAARDAVAKHRPDVVVVDVFLSEGLNFIKDLRRWSRNTRAVVVTRQASALTIQRALKAGAYGFVTRRDPLTAVIAAVLGAANGVRHIGPDVEKVLLSNIASGTIEIQGVTLSRLSDREFQIFSMVGVGKTCRTIASDLKLSLKTVETHWHRIRLKLDVSSGAELRQRATVFMDGSKGRVAPHQ